MINKIILILSLLTLSVFAKGAWREGEMEIRVYFENDSEFYMISDMKLSGDVYKSAGYANLYAIQNELNQIMAKGLKVDILEPDLQERSQNFWKSSSHRATYKNYNEILSIMNNLVSEYSDICSKKVYGESVDGRELSALKISDNTMIDEAEAEILLDGGIHGDELGGAENLIRFAQYLCNNYNDDATITELIDNREIWIYPMVNPDGRENMSRENANRVDLNRNWGYMWNGECATTAGFSQQETKAIRDCILENQFSIDISNHSGIEAIFLPWCYTRSVSPDYGLHESLANVYLSTSGYSYFEICQSNHDYATTGETVDYAYGVMGTAALTMELSRNKQPSNPTDIYNKNEAAMLEMIRYAGLGVEGFVTDAVSGYPIAARLYFDDSYPIYSDPELGDYHKYLGSGSYELRVEANGYESKTISGISISHNRKAITKDIELEPIGDSVIYGDRVVYIKKCTGVSHKVLGENDGDYVTLGSNGEIIIDMQYSLSDIQGNDFTVFSENSSSYQCYVSSSIDGDWISLGSGSGESDFDFSGAVNDSIRYIRIKGSNVYLDAVKARKDNSTSTSYLLKEVGNSYNVAFKNSKLIISGLKDLRSEITIYNALGRSCLKTVSNESSIIIERHNFSTGVYFIQIGEDLKRDIIKINITK